MKRRGWVTTSWRVTENGRRARYYELTSDGRKQLGVEEGSWQRVSAAVNWVLAGRLTPEGGRS
jgi:DNA-binding PadR family transcriptional regulator